MNFFKVTFISAMVVGLACANVSAVNDLHDLEQQYAQKQRESGVLINLIQSGLGTLGTMVTLPIFLESLNLTSQAAEATRICNHIGLFKYLSHDLVISCHNAEALMLGGTLCSLVFGVLTLEFGYTAAKGLINAIDKMEKAITD